MGGGLRVARVAVGIQSRHITACHDRNRHCLPTPGMLKASGDSGSGRQETIASAACSLLINDFQVYTWHVKSYVPAATVDFFAY